MKIQINSDNNITGTEGLSARLEATIEDGLRRFNEQVTRIEVHISDENGGKSGENDKKCMLEARLKGMQPLVVTNFANTIDESVHGAIGKMKSMLDTAIGQLRNH